VLNILALGSQTRDLGGPVCAVVTAEEMSGIRIDHFVRIDFNGFHAMTDALDGVEVCVPRPGIHDWRSPPGDPLEAPARAPGGAPASGAGAQTRSGGENICSGLPSPHSGT